MPWSKIFDATKPVAFLKPVPKGVDSVVADFNNDGRVDLFLLGRMELHPIGRAKQPHALRIAPDRATKGFSSSPPAMKFTPDWNKQDVRTTTTFTRIKIGAGARIPADLPFTLDPADPTVRGMPPAPTTEAQIPVMRIGYDAATQKWTVVVHSQLNATAPVVFSEVYFQVDSTSAITALTPHGLLPSDTAERPSLLINRSGRLHRRNGKRRPRCADRMRERIAGDFDNDMDVDLYLACRTGASNLANILYGNQGNGTFTKVADAGGAIGPVGVAFASGAGWADSVVTATTTSTASSTST